MPKKAAPIIVNNTEVMVPDQILSGSTVCGENVPEKAQAIKQQALR